jgi:hypothetical protein
MPVITTGCSARTSRVLAELGLDAYRFSIEWARVEPALADRPGREAVLGLSHETAALGTETGTGAGRAQVPSGVFLFTFSDKGRDTILRAHALARAAIKAASPATEVGITLALQDVQARPGGELQADEIWAGQFSDFLPALDGDDFIGVQNYSRIVVGPDRLIPAGDTDAEVTQMGYES